MSLTRIITLSGSPMWRHRMREGLGTESLVFLFLTLRELYTFKLAINTGSTIFQLEDMCERANHTKMRPSGKCWRKSGSKCRYNLCPLFSPRTRVLIIFGQFIGLLRQWIGSSGLLR